jgi:hypothetical protein
MENESIGKRGMGINYKGSQGQTKRAIVLQEEERRRRGRNVAPSNPNLRDTIILITTLSD